MIEGRSAAELREGVLHTTKELKTIGFDPSEMTVTAHETMTAQIDAELVKVSAVVPHLRRRKSEP